jgi:hypothetical protein
MKTGDMIPVSIVVMIIGFLLAFGFNQPAIKIPGSIGFTCGLLGFIGYSIIWIGQARPKVYEFIHSYTNTNPLNNHTRIVKRLSKREITQLKKNQTSDERYLPSTHDLFRGDPIIIDETITVTDSKDHKWFRVSGWIYAMDADEAKRTLHYYLFPGSAAVEVDEFFDFIP